MVDLQYISEGNSKTSCYSFDLPPKSTCPGMTEICGAKCYASKLFHQYPGVAAKYERNLELANSDKFVRYMVKNIPPRCEFRIHVSGDFCSQEYIAKWCHIAEARPDVKFYVYTRSWRVPKLVTALLSLNYLPSVNVNLSVDNDSGLPNFVGAERLRWCFLSDNDKAPSWLRATDIVFRTNHSAKIGHHQWIRKRAVERGQDPDIIAPLLHRIAGAITCPFERGKDMPTNFSCSRCGLCVNKPKVNV